jgi:cobalamin biosynthesis protein CbiG
MPDTVLGIARKHGVPARTIGKVGALGAALHITAGTKTFDAPLVRLDEAYHEAIPRLMSRAAPLSQ